MKLNFYFILALAHKVVGYNLSPDQKYELVKTINENFPGSPTVLTVGDGYNDYLMMKASDVSIEVCENNIENGGFGDIQIMKLENISRLIKIDGKNCAKTIDFSIRLRFFQSFLLTFTLFFSGALFNGKEFLDRENVTYFAILQSLDLLIIALSTKGIKTKISRKNFFVLEGLQKNNKFSFLMFNFLVISSCLVGLLCYLATILFLGNFLDSSGMAYDGKIINGFLFLVILAVSQEKIFVFYVENMVGKIKIIIHLTVMILIGLSYSLINLEKEVNYLSYYFMLGFVIAFILIFKYIVGIFLDFLLAQLNYFLIKMKKKSKKIERTEKL